MTYNKDRPEKDLRWGRTLLSLKYTAFKIYFLLLFQLLDANISFSVEAVIDWSTF